MDYFHGLDLGCYGAFKKSMLNGLAIGAFDPPSRVNDVYRIAAKSEKTTSPVAEGTSVLFITIEDNTKK
jgi:hypothetical protein